MATSRTRSLPKLLSSCMQRYEASEESKPDLLASADALVRRALMASMGVDEVT